MEHSKISGGEHNQDRQEVILQTYYGRLRDIDTSIRDLINFFFTINALLIGVVVQFIKSNFQQFIVALLGYFVSVAILCITYKGFLSWRLYYKDMRLLEETLGYDISEKYEKRLKGTPGEIIRVTLIRLRFSFLFLGFWLAVIIYFLFHQPPLIQLNNYWLNALSGIVLLLVISYAPWIYFIGLVKPNVVWSVVRATWGKEI